MFSVFFKKIKALRSVALRFLKKVLKAFPKNYDIESISDLGIVWDSNHQPSEGLFNPRNLHQDLLNGPPNLSI